MRKTIVVNKYKEKYDVYAGRGSIWGNPYIIGKDGTREEVIEKYEEYIRNGDGKHLLDRLYEIEGKILGCFCKPAACHCDVLVKLIEEKAK